MDTQDKDMTAFLNRLGLRTFFWVLLAAFALATTAGADEAGFTFAFPNYVVLENARTAAVQIVRTGLTNTAASVSLVTSNQTAQAGLDYVFTSVRLDFSPGETNKTVFIPILDDTLGEGDERLYLKLFEPSTNAFVWNDWVSLTIVDNDDVFSFSATNYVVGEGNTNLVVTVLRTGTPSLSPIALLYSTTSGTAIPGVNYSNANGYLVFQLFDTTKAFSIPILEDNLVESNATFFLHLSLGYGSTAMLTTSNAK